MTQKTKCFQNSFTYAAESNIAVSFNKIQMVTKLKDSDKVFPIKFIQDDIAAIEDHVTLVTFSDEAHFLNTFSDEAHFLNTFSDEAHFLMQHIF